MALGRVITALLFTLALACVEPSSSHVVKGSVSCYDCSKDDDLSGIKVAVKCDGVQKLSMATTDVDGSFTTRLHADTSSSSSNCHAKLLGGPRQLCASRKDQVSKVVKDEQNSFTVSTPLSFSTSCPSKGATATPEMEASMTATVPDLPLPPEWGLAPSSYYIPFIPIIGIP